MSRLLPQAQGCPVPLAHQCLVDAAIEFCEETAATQSVTDPVALLSGRATYDLDLPSDMEASRVTRVWVGPRALTLIAQAPPPDAASGAPHSAYVAERDTITLYPTPDAGAYGALTARVTTRPKRTARALDDVLYRRWIEPLVAGALFRLRTTPGQPFTDLAAAAVAHADFWRGINRARIEANRGGAAASLSVQARPLA